METAASHRQSLHRVTGADDSGVYQEGGSRNELEGGRGGIYSFRGSSVFERRSGLSKVNICATSVMMLPCYTTPPLTSRLPFLPPLIGRGAPTDSGEPLLWQLPPERRTQGQPDVCQRPARSDRARQKPIRWDATAAGFQEFTVTDKFRGKREE